jgi:tRNA pseudouridine55 synthase
MQTAPQHSALKYKGKPLYHYARKNISVPEKRRQVRVHELTLEKSENDNITLFIRCGGGFYVRSLAHDLGVRVGCGAYLSALRRLQCAPFDIAQAQVLDSLTTSATAKQLSIETALTHLPAQSVDNTRLWALAQGQRECPPSDENEESGQLVRLQTANNRFAGVARQRETCFLPQKLLSWTREKKNYDN